MKNQRSSTPKVTPPLPSPSLNQVPKYHIYTSFTHLYRWFPYFSWNAFCILALGTIFFVFRIFLRCLYNWHHKFLQPKELKKWAWAEHTHIHACTHTQSDPRKSLQFSGHPDFLVFFLFPLEIKFLTNNRYEILAPDKDTLGLWCMLISAQWPPQQWQSFGSCLFPPLDFEFFCRTKSVMIQYLYLWSSLKIQRKNIFEIIHPKARKES